MDYEHPTRLDRLMHCVAEHHPLRAAETFAIHGMPVVVESNSEPLIAALRAHYAPYAGPDGADDAREIRVVAIQSSTPDLDLDFRRWPRDAQLIGHGDQYVDIPGGRVVRDATSGLQFLLGADLALTVGACLEHRQLVFELIDASVMERLGARGYLSCRGSVVARGERALIIAGPPRSGKSALALRLLEHGFRLVALDRFMLQLAPERRVVLGMPGASRLSPGTPSRAPQLVAALPVASVHGIVVLAWQPAQTGDCVIQRKTLADQPGLSSLLAKRPGPLCRASLVGRRSPSGRSYGSFERQLECSAELPLWELRERADFERAVALCREIFAD